MTRVSAICDTSTVSAVSISPKVTGHGARGVVETSVADAPIAFPFARTQETRSGQGCCLRESFADAEQLTAVAQIDFLARKDGRRAGSGFQARARDLSGFARRFEDDDLAVVGIEKEMLAGESDA